MTRPLTPKEARILAYIVGHIGEHGYAPSREEMMTYLGVRGRAALEYSLMSLVIKGRIRTEGARAIRIVGARWAMQPLEAQTK